MLASSYHNVNMPKYQTSFKPEWTKEHKLYQKAVETLFMDFAHCVYLWNVYLFLFCIHYLFIYVFLLFPEVQKCIFFWHCARLFVYLWFYFISRSVMFSGTVHWIYRFISVVSFWNRHHNVLNKYKYCEKKNTFLPLLFLSICILLFLIYLFTCSF